MRKRCLLCLAAVLLSAATCCAQSKITNIYDLAYKKIAVPRGTVADKLVLSTFPHAQIVYYDSVLDCAVAVKAGLAQAAAYDEFVLRTILRTNGDLLLLPTLITQDSYGFAVNLSRPDLKAAVDEAIDELEAAGALARMARGEWFDVAAFMGLSESKAPATGGVLRFGTHAGLEPFAFKIETGEVMGFDIELAFYVAQKLGLRLEVYDMPFEKLFEALGQNKVDMIGAGLSITPERAEKALFSQPYSYGGIAALVKN